MAWRKDRITSNRLMMKIETRSATKMFVATFVQEHLELGLLQQMNFCQRRNRYEGDNPNGNIQTNNINHDNLNNNEVDEINNATNSPQNNQNENQEYFYWNDIAGTQFVGCPCNTCITASETI